MSIKANLGHYTTKCGKVQAGEYFCKMIKTYLEYDILYDQCILHIICVYFTFVKM